MHIVHVITRLLRAGSEENTIATCAWQAKAGHRVTLLHGRDWDRHWVAHMPQGVQRICISEMVHPIRPMQDRRALLRLRQVYRQLKPDVIHTHQSKAGILGRLAAPAVPQATVVHGIHILPFEGVSAAKRALYIAAEKRAARHTDLFIGVSDAAGRAYVDAGIAPAHKVHCARSGMALKPFQSAQKPADWRALLGVQDHQTRPPVVLMMAAFEPRKKHEAFLAAMARVLPSVPGLKILLAGDGPLRAQVQATVDRLGLTNHVVFAGHRPDPQAMFALADLAVLTSTREGLPRVAVQAMAAGCPMVVQDLPGLDEIIRDGANGRVLPQGQMQRVAQEVVDLLQNSTRLKALRAGARATDVSAWRLETLGARTTALYGREPVLVPTHQLKSRQVA